MKTNSLIYILLFTLFTMGFTSCISTGDTIKRTYKSNVERDFNQSQVFYMITEEDLDRYEHVVLGRVSATGKNGSSDNTILDHLFYEAWSHGANAILITNNEWVERRESTIYLLNDDEDREDNCCDECNEEEENDTHYVTGKYSGYAVWVAIDDDFKEQYGTGENMSFTYQIPRSDKSESTAKGLGVVSFLVGGIVLVIANLGEAGSD